MAGYLPPSGVVVVLVLACFISQTCCRLDKKSNALKYGDKKVKVLNYADNYKYADCGSLLKAGYNISGVYRLTLNKTDIQIPCEFINGKAFTVILRRVSNSLSFIQTWSYYENGFGNPLDNYWAGLAVIYALTLAGQRTLQINMQDWAGINENAVYSSFYLEQRSTRYRLHVAGYSGKLPDELSYHNNMPFSTYDAPDPNGCASNMKAGWWYNYCAYTLPTGIYYNGGWYTPSGTMYDGIFWKDWYGYNYSLKFISMTLSS